MAKKKKTIAALVNQAAELTQKLVKLKAADENGYCRCVTCGVVKHWKEMQGGHFISRTWTATKLLEENINVQCGRCNGPLRGNMIQYTIYMIDMYGRDFVEELQDMKGKTKKYSRPEILDIIDELKTRVNEYEANQ